MPFVKKCPFLRQKIEEEVRVLDYRHSCLVEVPSEVFDRERTLEELYADCNQIRDLPRELFCCHGLRKLSVSDNEITSIPSAISSLTNLQELDISKNGIIEVPDSIKSCKYLRFVDASVNPLGKLPEGFTHLGNLTQLCLNDTFLDYLPGSFGRMVTLKILELRENHLKTLPRSFSRLVHLERLDIGNNELTELSDVVGGLTSLLEMWCDNNQITTLAENIGNLKQLIFLDASYNQLCALPAEIEGCASLADLHLTGNNMEELPASIGNLAHLTTLKVDKNHLKCLPQTLGALSSLSELNISGNNLHELPGSIGLLRNLRTLYADENMLWHIPAETIVPRDLKNNTLVNQTSLLNLNLHLVNVKQGLHDFTIEIFTIGSCSGITVLSLRSNKLTYIPDEVGRIPGLRVLNLSDNLLHCLPFSIVKLKELQALWLTENQTRPLIPLQSELEGESGRKILTCYLLPQGHTKDNDQRQPEGDSESFQASMWDQDSLCRQQIHFDSIDSSDEGGSLIRCPTPYPKEVRVRVRHAHNLALKQKISVEEGCTQVADISCKVHQRHLTTRAFGQEGNVSYSKLLEHSESQIREARITKPTSPRLTETHNLHRCDKVKLWKDKSVRQHNVVGPDCGSNVSKVLAESRNKHKKEATTLSGSVPDLAPCGKEAEVDVARSSIPINSDLFSKHFIPHHRRSRPVRGYDSDTGYRSDGEILCVPSASRDLFSLEQLSVWSQPVAHHNLHQHRGHSRQGRRVTSDLAGYAGGSTFPTANAAAAAFRKQLKNNLPPHVRVDSLRRGAQLPAAVAASSINLNPCTPLKSETHHDSMPFISEAGTALTAQPGMTPTSHPVMISISHPVMTMNLQPDRTLASQQDRIGHINGRFQTSTSSNYSKTSQVNLANIVCNDQLYSYASISKHHDSTPVKVSNSSDHAALHLFSGEAEMEQPAPSSLGSVADTRVHSATPVEIATNLSHKSIAAVLQSPHHDGQHELPPAVNSLISSHKLCFQQHMHAVIQPPVTFSKDSYVQANTHTFSKDSYVRRNTPTFSQEICTVPGLAAWTRGGQSGMPAEVYATAKQSSTACDIATNNKAPEHGESLASSSTYISTPLYQRKGGKSPGVCTNRLSSDSSSSRIASPHSASCMSVSLEDASYTNFGSGIPNLHLNQVQSSTCGFHGSNPFPNLPGPYRVKVNSSNAIGQGEYNGLGPVRSVILFKDNNTSGSGSSSSQLVSASQHGQIYPVEVQSRRLTEAQSQRSEWSGNSNSHSDLHNLMFSHEPPHSGVPSTRSAQTTSRQDMTYNHYTDSFGKIHDDDSTRFASQEQCSHVSSSTDSGYSRGQSLLESVSDYQQAAAKLKSKSPILDMTVVPSTGRHTSIKAYTNIWPDNTTSVNIASESAPQEHTSQFHVTIHKNPGLGFSIAGGVGAHGNPYKRNDIGIFVTKVSCHGPAWKLLQPGDKILQVNNVNFRAIEHSQAVFELTSNTSVNLLIERVQTVNLV